MIDREYRPSFELGSLPLGAKVTLTAFLALLGGGYLVALGNIYMHHAEADLEPGLTPADVVRVYHGLEKEMTVEMVVPKSAMLKQVEPGGAMRKYLEKGGEESVRVLMAWLEDGAERDSFEKEELVEPGDPSPQDVIAETCVRCHNATSGEKSDTPYAETRDDLPTFELVSQVALPPVPDLESGKKTVYLPPMGLDALVQVTHVHIISIPMFALAVAALFLLTNQSARVKALLTPIPMLAVCLDIGSWWLARPLEPFAYLVAAAGAIFGTALALQLVCVLGSLWLGGSKARAA
jgi:hypothetical protein